MRIEYHRTLIADHVRNQAFLNAMKAMITPGVTTVADIGAGTGLLGMMAARLGAKEVFLYEAAEVAGVAARILKVNKIRNAHLFPCHSTEMDNPPQVDLVVSETLGNYALEENIIDTMADARARHLKPGGAIIPRRIEQVVAPVTAPRIHEELAVWDLADAGLDLSTAKAMSFNNVYVRAMKAGELFDAGRSAQVWDVIDLARDDRSSRKGTASWQVGEKTAVYGFAVWWTCNLAPGVSLSTASSAPRTHWDQLYFPLPAPIVVRPGETVDVTLKSRSSEAEGTHLSWTARRIDGRGKVLERHVMDLDKGYLP